MKKHLQFCHEKNLTIFLCIRMLFYCRCLSKKTAFRNRLFTTSIPAVSYPAKNPRERRMAAHAIGIKYSQSAFNIIHMTWRV